MKIKLMTAGMSLLAVSSLQAQQKPNVVFIVADDLGYGDLSCFGQEKFRTPHIDRLALNGTRFTRSYAGTTVSAPSRASLMTGLHTGHAPIRGNKEIPPEGQFPLPADTYTLFHLFKDAGYTTGAFGKWGLGFPGSTGDPMNQGVDHFFGYNCQLMAHNYYPDHLWSNKTMIRLPENDHGRFGTYLRTLFRKKHSGSSKNKKRIHSSSSCPLCFPTPSWWFPKIPLYSSCAGHLRRSPMKVPIQVLLSEREGICPRNNRVPHMQPW